MSWYNTQVGQRSFAAGDRLPDLHLPQVCPIATPPANRPSRGGSFDSTSNYSNSAPSLTSSYSSIDTGLGIKTPPSNESPDSSAVQFPKEHQQFYQEVGYGGAMNQGHSYMDNQHPQISTSSSYASQPQTTGMSHYQQYPTQAASAYAPPQSSYSHYYGGVTSPQTAGPTAVSMGAQLLPLPS